MRKIALLAAAAALIAAGPALAGNKSSGGFNDWSAGEVFSGSAVEFNFSNSFDEVGASFGGIAAEGFNSGSATAGGHFNGDGFDAYATSENYGNIKAVDFGVGIGFDHRMDFDAASYGASFGSVEWNMDSFSRW